VLDGGELKCAGGEVGCLLSELECLCGSEVGGFDPTGGAAERADAAPGRRAALYVILASRLPRARWEHRKYHPLRGAPTAAALGRVAPKRLLGGPAVALKALIPPN
jgi:hypothetical protein